MGQRTFHLIPHTHWDREWYLTRATFQARLIPMIDGVLDQLEHDPAARFLLDGQTILLDDYLAVKPEHASRIAAQVARGALEIGPWYLLADLQIPSVASLRRNLEEGRRDAARFGKHLDVLYSPDAFGHPAFLPDLAAEFGMHRAVIRRGLGVPGDLFRWEGASNTVLVHHLPPGGYDYAIDLCADNADLAALWPPLRKDLMDRASTDQVAVFLGADHHAMVPAVSELCARLQSIEPEHRIRVSGLTEYFDAVESRVPHLPVIRGELRRGNNYTWVLQDVLSTRSRLKRKHARAEWLLARVAEPLARQAESEGAPSREGLIRLAWRTLLQCQFHDTIAGSTSDEVQLEQVTRLNSVAAITEEVSHDSLADLAHHDADAARDHPDATDSCLVLWNPSSRPQSHLMTTSVSFFRRDILVGPPTGRLPREGNGYQPFALEAPDGQLIPVQVIRTEKTEERLDARRHYPDQDIVDRVWIAFETPVLGPHEVVALRLRPMELPLPSATLTANAGQLTNAQLSVAVSPLGQVTMTDRRNGEAYPGLFTLMSEADGGDLYTFSNSGLLESTATAIAQSVIASGPLVAAVETTWRTEIPGHGHTDVTLLLTLCVDSPIVRARYELNHHAENHRLRARFPVGVSGALAGAAVGTEARLAWAEPVATGTIEHEVHTAPAHHFVAGARDGRGLLIVSPGCFEYEWTVAGEARITLLRAVGELAREGLPERPGRAGWPMATPYAQEAGRHLIEIAVCPVDETMLHDEAARTDLVERILLPPVAHHFRQFASPAD